MRTTADLRERAQERRLLRSLYRSATPAEIDAGQIWYPNAFKCAANVATWGPKGFGPIRAAGVLAALSPGTRWEIAEQMALDAAFAAADPTRSVDNAVRGAYPVQRAKAKSLLLTGAHPRDVLRGPKEYAFWLAIIGRHSAVPIDRWAARAAGVHQDKLTKRQVRNLTAAYSTVAHQEGETPRNFQAIVWVVIRDRKDHDEVGSLDTP